MRTHVKTQGVQGDVKTLRKKPAIGVLRNGIATPFYRDLLRGGIVPEMNALSPPQNSNEKPARLTGSRAQLKRMKQQFAKQIEVVALTEERGFIGGDAVDHPTFFLAAKWVRWQGFAGRWAIWGC